MSDYGALAKRCETMGNVNCPFCGDENFDLPGLSNHLNLWCEVERAASAARSNVDLAAILMVAHRESQPA